MGIPNPMQKLKYVMPEQSNQALLTNGQSGSTEPENHSDMSKFATKDDINALREEVRQMSQRNMSRAMSQNQMSQNQNGSNAQGNQNRGGNT